MMFDNPQQTRTTYRVTDPGRLAEIAAVIGSSLIEARRIAGGGVRPSTFRAWTVAGHCYEMWKSGPEAMQPRRVEALDRATSTEAA